MGLLDLIAAPSPERAKQTLSDLVRGPQNRLRGLLDDPAGFMGGALREGLGADDMERRWAWNQNRLDAMTGSDYTRASVDDAANRAALNLALMGSMSNPVVKGLKQEIAVGKNALKSLQSAGVTDDAGRMWTVSGNGRTREFSREFPNYIETIPDWNLFAAPQEARARLYELSDLLNKKEAALANSKETLQAVKGALQDAPIQQPSWVGDMFKEPRSVTGDYKQWWLDELGLGGDKAKTAFLRAAAKNDDFFLYGRPVGKTPEAVVEHFSKRSGIPLSAERSGNDMLLRNPATGESMTIMDFTGNQPIIRSINMKAGSGTGKPAYQTANQILANAGKRAFPDTDLTDINDYRKVGNALASQLRTGKQTTVMNSSLLNSSNPSVGNMLSAEAAETYRRSANAAKIRFDGESFIDTSGKKLSDADVMNLLGGYNKGVGPLSAKRAAVDDYLNGLTRTEAEKLGKKWKAGALFPGLLAFPLVEQIWGQGQELAD